MYSKCRRDYSELKILLRNRKSWEFRNIGFINHFYILKRRSFRCLSNIPTLCLWTVIRFTNTKFKCVIVFSTEKVNHIRMKEKNVGKLSGFISLEYITNKRYPLRSFPDRILMFYESRNFQYANYKLVIIVSCSDDINWFSPLARIFNACRKRICTIE